MADTTTTTPTEPSMSELRAMIATTTQAETPAAQQQTSETTAAETATEEHTEAATETAEEHTNSETSDDELPPGVRKRIAKEAEKAARIQSEIDRAVSDRKAKEAKLAQLKAEGTGAEPAQNTDKPATSKRPEPGEPGHEKETYPQYEVRRDEWLKAEAIRSFREQTDAETRQRTAREKWDAAVTKHGADFPTLMESARELAPEGLQKAISSLDNWDGVAVHLAKHPDELRQLAGVYSQNPTRAIATLGRIEAALTKESDTATTEKKAKPLPEPLRKIGGTASASGEDLQKSLEGGNFAHFKAAMTKLRK